MNKKESQPSHRTAPVKDATAFELQGALEKQLSCPVCHLTRQMVSKRLDSIAYASVTDPETRARLRGALGYCSAHGQAWVGMADSLATAMIYDDVFREVEEILQVHLNNSSADAESATQTGERLKRRVQRIFGGGSEGAEAGQALADALMPQEPCPACAYTEEVEQRLVRAFAGAVENHQFMNVYTRHPVGLCLPHLRAVLPAIGGHEALNRLVRAYHDNLRDTRAQLQEVIRKNDHRYSSEPHGDEFAAPARSVEQAGGLLPTQINTTADTKDRS